MQSVQLQNVSHGPQPDPDREMVGRGCAWRLTRWCPPQVLLFLALFGASLYLMCNISVGLDQELALPKVSWGGPVCALLSLPSVPWGVGKASSIQQVGWHGPGAWWGTAHCVELGGKAASRKGQELRAAPPPHRPRLHEGDHQASKGLAAGDDHPGRIAEGLPSAGHSTSSVPGSTAAHVTALSSGHPCLLLAG